MNFRAEFGFFTVVARSRTSEGLRFTACAHRPGEEMAEHGEYLTFCEVDRFVVQLLIAYEVISGRKSIVLDALQNQRRNKTGEATGRFLAEVAASVDDD